MEEHAETAATGGAGPGRSGRGTALGLLVLTVMVSDCGPAAGPDSRDAAAPGLEARIGARLDSLDARTGFYARHLPSGREIAIRADQPMNTLSVIKISAMARAFQRAEAGTLDLDARHTIRPDEIRGGSGLLQTFQPGLSPTYRDVITQMIITSDNTATDLVVAAVGLDDINHMLDSLGYEVTRFRTTTGDIFAALAQSLDSARAAAGGGAFDAGRVRFDFEGDAARWLGVSTPRETARLLTQIYEGGLASEEHSQEMVNTLRRQLYASRLPRRIGQEAQVAHKTGDWPPYGANDVGLIFYEGGPLVVAIYVNQNRGDFRQVEETMGLIAEDLIHTWRE